MIAAGPAACRVLLPGDVPVVPDADQARGWVRQELADPVYHQQRSLLQRLWDWLSGLLDGIGTVADGGAWWVLVAALAVAAVAVIAFRIAGPVRRDRSRRERSVAVHTAGDLRTAEQLRAAADAAARAGDHDRAVADRFRALVRGLEERAVLEEWPGRTAHEAAEAAGARLPGLRGRLRSAGVLFDAVVYGRRSATAQDDEALRELDGAVAATRPGPVPAAAAPRPTGSAGGAR